MKSQIVKKILALGVFDDVRDTVFNPTVKFTFDSSVDISRDLMNRIAAAVGDEANFAIAPCYGKKAELRFELHVTFR